MTASASSRGRAETILAPIEMSDSLAVLIQGSQNPVFRGTEPEGEAYLCGVCESQILVEAAGGSDLYDLAFRCVACSGLSMGPRLPPGRPLPWQKTVVLDPGQYMLRNTVEGRGDVVLAGREAVDRALQQLGSDTAIDLDDHEELDADLFELRVAAAKRLLGVVYEELRASRERGRQSKTPPPHPHRLMELLDAAEGAIESFRAGAPAIDPVATVELFMTLDQLARWRNNPVWPSLLPSLKSPREFPHLVATLAAASFLSDAGNGVELIPVGGERRPDLRVHLGARSVVGVEVKTPLRLQRPVDRVLGPQRAEAIVRKALRSARSGAGGQLSPESDAILVVLGFSLRESHLDELEAAAKRVLREYVEFRRHILGIAIVSLGVLLDGMRPSAIGHTVPALTGILQNKVVPNENYSGVNRLSQEERPGLRRVKAPLRELELNADTQLCVGPAAGGQLRRDARERIGRNKPCWCGSGRKFKKCHGR